MDLLDIIKFEGDDQTLVWKHSKEDFNTHSQLIVHESQEAILYKNGKALDSFGPGKYTLKTENIPLLRNIINIPTGGLSPFHCEVYFINKATALNVNWGTSSQIQILDPTFNIPIHVGASGVMEFVIANSRKFIIKVVGTTNYIDSIKLAKYFREKIATKVKTYLGKMLTEISYLAINQHLEEISEALKDKISDDFKEYGVKLVNFYLSNVVVPEKDTTKLNEVLNKKLEYGTLDYSWGDEQIADISKKYASNPGNKGSGVGGMMAEMPIALAFGEMLKTNITDNITNNLFNKSKALKNDNRNNNTNNNRGFCPNCGDEIEEREKFCSNCGKQIVKKCEKCGENLEDRDNFCPNCGEKIN
ncbi:MAG: SPFH domain-containing protein [Methanobrevibacter sp.]|jgi:membrane protease subunit (stomatin/prohibitin family)|nr:SPFH domain-containing protein [Methanobrevibacter sp.]